MKERAKHKPSLVGLVLKEHRKLLGMTQEQAANHLGIEPRTLRMYENGERALENVRELRRISTVLGIEPQRFGLAALTLETCTPEQIEEVVKNAWGFMAQARFTEAHTMIEGLLRDLHYHVAQETHVNVRLLRALADAHHLAGHVASVLFRSNELGLAIHHFQEMEDIARHIQDDTLLSRALTYHGDMIRRQGNLTKATAYLEAARDVTPNADSFAHGDCAQLLGRTYLQTSNADGFERSLAHSAEVATSLKLIGTETRGPYNLGTVYEEYARGYNVLGETNKSLYKKSFYYLELARKNLPDTKRWDMVLRATEAEALVRSGETQEGIQRAISVAFYARAAAHSRLLERIYRLHRYLDRKMAEINQATMSLREALIGPV
jgi:transcriptional regulator with XRE-family HTH domain